MTRRSPKRVALDFLELVASGKVDEAWDQHVGTSFRHHNPWFRGDAASLRNAMAQNAVDNPHKVLEVKSAVEEGDRVMVHSHIRQHPNDVGTAVVHIFRFEGDRIVEVWDVAQAVPENPVNETGMF